MADTIDRRTERMPEEADRLKADASRHRAIARAHLRSAALDESRLAELEQRTPAEQE